MEAFLKNTLKWLAVSNMVALLLIVCWQVLSRYAVGDPSTISEELARILLMWLGMLGAAYTAGIKGHMAIDLISAKAPGYFQTFLRRLIIVLTALFAVIFFMGGVRMILIVTRLEQTTPVMGIPVGIVYIAAPLSAAFIFCFALFEYWREFASEGEAR